MCCCPALHAGTSQNVSWCSACQDGIVCFGPTHQVQARVVFGRRADCLCSPVLQPSVPDFGPACDDPALSALMKLKGAIMNGTLLNFDCMRCRSWSLHAWDFPFLKSGKRWPWSHGSEYGFLSFKLFVVKISELRLYLPNSHKFCLFLPLGCSIIISSVSHVGLLSTCQRRRDKDCYSCPFSVYFRPYLPVLSTLDDGLGLKYSEWNVTSELVEIIFSVEKSVQQWSFPVLKKKLHA